MRMAGMMRLTTKKRTMDERGCVCNLSASDKRTILTRNLEVVGEGEAEKPEG